MDRDELERLEPALEAFLEEFEDCARPPTRKLIAAYVRGQLGPLPRKSIRPMAHAAGVPPRTLQELLSLHRWDADRLRARLQRRALRSHGGPGVLGLIHESACPKRGPKTPGVERQRSPSSGRIENCCVLVHLGFGDGDFHGLLDSELYLPRSWTDDAGRRQSAGIPGSVRYRSKTQIALDLIDRARAAGMEPGWIVVAPEYGADSEFLKAVADRGFRYVTMVPSDPAEKGHSSGESRVLVSNASGEVAATVLVELSRAGAEAERVLEANRREIGLDHFEVRSYRSLSRHLVLSAMSLLFLAEARHRCSSSRRSAGIPETGVAVRVSPGQRSGTGSL